MSHPQAVNLSQLEKQNDSTADYPQYMPAAMAQHNQQSSRHQSGSYPSPRSYPSPQMSASYTYPPPEQHPSPTASSMSLPSHNTLPPLRHVKGQPQSIQHPSQQAMGSPMLPSVAPMSAYYQHPGQGVPPVQHMSPAQAAAMRYPMHHVQDPKMISGGRSRKEIKRRTKTGCLTCRKRRIKCDEAHPHCRNCQKSKRECLGYDPIFKQQPGRPQIQSADNSAAASHSVPSSTGPPPHSYSVPHGYAPASTTAFPLGVGSTGSPSSSLDHNFDFASAIDPALAGVDHSLMSHMHFDDAHFRDDKLAVGSTSPFSTTSTQGQNQKGPNLPFSSGFAKRIKINELLSIGGIIPPPLPPTDPGDTIPQDVLDEIKVLFAKDYGVNLDRFFETTWYSSKGLESLLANTLLLHYFAGFVHKLRETTSENYEGMLHVQSHETALVWHLMSLCRTTSSIPTTNGANSHTGIDDAQLDTARKRLDVFEHLITNSVLDINPLSPPLPHTETNYGLGRERELEFWRLVGQFTSVPPNAPSSAKMLDDTLSYLRNILDMQENRDVLYSMAIARHIGGRMPDFPDHLQQAYNNDDADDRSKLYVAKRFIEDEAAGKGTSQVVQRICGMAVKSWSAGR